MICLSAVDSIWIPSCCSDGCIPAWFWLTSMFLTLADCESTPDSRLVFMPSSLDWGTSNGGTRKYDDFTHVAYLLPCHSFTGMQHPISRAVETYDWSYRTPANSSGPPEPLWNALDSSVLLSIHRAPNRAGIEVNLCAERIPAPA